MNKCIKGKSCLHCDTSYCRFKDEITELKIENEKLAIRVTTLNERFINGFNYNEHRYKQAMKEIREYCEEQNLKADYTACDIIAKINEVIGVE